MDNTNDTFILLFLVSINRFYKNFEHTMVPAISFKKHFFLLRSKSFLFRPNDEKNEEHNSPCYQLYGGLEVTR